MAWVRILIVVVAGIQAGWMVLNGASGLLLGRYFELRKGVRADEPAVWEGIVRAAGIAPRSAPMKLIFVVYGAAWLVIIYQFARHRPWGRAAMIAAQVGSLWYLGPGTPVVLMQLFLLVLLPSSRPPEQAPA